MTTHNIQIDTVRAGQPRPYADSVYEYVLTFTGGTLGKFTPTQDMVERYVKVIHNPRHDEPVKKKNDPTMEFHHSYFEAIEKLDENKWKIVIVSPYLD